MSNYFKDFEHQIEIDKIHDRQLAEKELEIQRLKAENDSLIEQFKAIRETCYAKDALITELGKLLQRVGWQIAELRMASGRLLALITKLADALETTGTSHDDWQALVEKLVQRAQRAREGTR